MSLMSVLALAFLFVAIVSLVVLEGRETNRDHQQVVIVTIEPLLAPRKVRSLLRKHPRWSALIALASGLFAPQRARILPGIPAGKRRAHRDKPVEC